MGGGDREKRMMRQGGETSSNVREEHTALFAMLCDVTTLATCAQP